MISAADFNEIFVPGTPHPTDALRVAAGFGTLPGIACFMAARDFAVKAPDPVSVASEAWVKALRGVAATPARPERAGSCTGSGGREAVPLAAGGVAEIGEGPAGVGPSWLPPALMRGIPDASKHAGVALIPA